MFLPGATTCLSQSAFIRERHRPLIKNRRNIQAHTGERRSVAQPVCRNRAGTSPLGGSNIRNCPEPVILPLAGHFVQEHGEVVAEAAVALFAGPVATAAP